MLKSNNIMTESQGQNSSGIRAEQTNHLQEERNKAGVRFLYSSIQDPDKKAESTNVLLKVGPQVSSLGNTWTLLRNAESQVQSLTYCICIFKKSPGDFYAYYSLRISNLQSSHRKKSVVRNILFQLVCHFI